ncbi:ATP-binding protein [Alsobacter sp. R-9]
MQLRLAVAGALRSTASARPTGVPPLRIASKVILVGGIPIAMAAVIAATAWLLLQEADRARSGAVLAGSIYRDVLVSTAERDRFIVAPSQDRMAAAGRFFALTNRARSDLAALVAFTRTPEQTEAVQRASSDLSRYTEQMGLLVHAMEQSERLVREMAERASRLIALTDEARVRQRASNADIVNSLAEKDRRLSLIGDVVDKTQDLRALVALAAADGAGRGAARAELRNASQDLAAALEAAGRGPDVAQLRRLTDSLNADAGVSTSTGTLGATGRALVDWCERLLKIDETERRSLQEEVAQLLTYSVKANETEQATQNVAISALKLGQRSGQALGNRDIGAVAILGEESAELAASISALPISPLIQSEMVDAIRAWRDRLLTTSAGLRQQNATAASMDLAAEALTQGASELNDTFTGDADRLGGTTRKILLIGATIALLTGIIAALVVARSITLPLHRLRLAMLKLADDPASGGVTDAGRGDELGDMARAANVFVGEIVVRERALREAVSRADQALADLRRTQADLIQAEKLASLGQLVAGVAHEINTPVGVALTTATQMGEEARGFAEEARGDQLRRSRLIAFTERMTEGSRLLFANLTRAADLVQSFKRVAVDQVSGERRRVDLREWLAEIVTSLTPVLRKRGLSVTIDCPPDVEIETYPGALGQVVTNLVVNASIHAYDEGQSGEVAISVAPHGMDRVTLVVADRGRGIDPEDLGRIFDPFFTTARQRGSTGLGLHIVYNLVAQTLKGRIDVWSEPGRGTRYTIDLPRVAAPADAAGRNGNANAQGRTGS